jgi:hypothetical protein
MKAKFNLIDAVVVLVFGLLIVLQIFVYRTVWNVDYLLWYIRNGAQISWVAAILGLFWGDINKNNQLISARPVEYLRAYVIMLAGVFSSWASIFGKRNPDTRLKVTSYTLLDMCFSFLIAFIFTVLILLWTLTVVPIQFFVFIVCGAPARISLYSREAFTLQEETFNTVESKEFWQSTIEQKPVSLTLGIAGMLFWLVQFIQLSN